MNLNPLSLLEKAINEHGSAAILKERLALAADQFTALERKLADAIESLAKKEILLAEKDILLAEQAIRIGELQSDNRSLHFELQNLQTQRTTQKPVIQKPADMCPFCRCATGELLEIKPHPIFGDGGLRVGYYKCTNCEKKYDKEMPT